MKTIGLLGGMGPESTINYYKDIIDQYRKITNKDEYPNILINSIDMTRMLSYVAKEEFQELVEYLTDELNKLIKAGAEICAICSNTPHIVFDKLKENISTPLLSIVDSTAIEAERKKLTKLLLIGTSFTMNKNFYAESFKKCGIELIVPCDADKEVIHNIIFPELEEGIVIPEKKEVLLNICNSIIDKEKLDGIILGCTELPLMIKDEDFDIDVLNTVDAHISNILSVSVNQSLDL